MNNGVNGESIQVRFVQHIEHLAVETAMLSGQEKPVEVRGESHQGQPAV